MAKRSRETSSKTSVSSSKSAKKAIPRDLESICKRYQLLPVGKKAEFKKEVMELNDFLWFNRTDRDHLTLRGVNLMYEVESELEDIEDSFGIGFLDMNKCSLHFFAYSDENEEVIKKFTEKSEMAIIFAK